MKMREELLKDKENFRKEIGDLICITPTDKAGDWKRKWAIVGFVNSSKSQIKGVLYLGNTGLVEQLGATYDDNSQTSGVVMDIILE